MPPPTRVPNVNRRTAVRLGSGGLAAALAGCRMQSTQAQELATHEANKAVVSRVFAEAVNGRNVAVIRELYAPGFVSRGTWSRQMLGPAGMPLTIDQFHAEFPDLTVTVEASIAEDDLVAALVTWRGTHPPAGTHLVGRTMHLFRLANEQIIEEWSTGWEWANRPSHHSASWSTNPLAGT
jgi:predicted SnoaL-like aldol condensation-catalyzing enzyme